MPLKPNTDNFQSIPILPHGSAVKSLVFVLFILGIMLKKPVEFIKEWFFFPPLFFISQWDFRIPGSIYVLQNHPTLCIREHSCVQENLRTCNWHCIRLPPVSNLSDQRPGRSGFVEGSFQHRFGGGLALRVPGVPAGQLWLLCCPVPLPVSKHSSTACQEQREKVLWKLPLPIFHARSVLNGNLPLFAGLFSFLLRAGRVSVAFTLSTSIKN